MINVKKNWWKDYFNDLYLLTDARSVCDAQLTRKEVNMVEELLHPGKDDNIIDLFGGQGRHSLELAKRGYRNLTVLDYSPFLVNMGKEEAKKENAKIKFYRRDARVTKLKSAKYKNALVMANSFGYFEDEKDNVAVLKEAKRILKTGGKLLLDLTDADYLKERLRDNSQHQAKDGIYVYRSRELNNDIIKAREVVVSAGRGVLRDGTYCEHLYSEEKIKKLLTDLGFKDVHVYKGLSLHKDKTDYGFLTSRMMVVAEK